MRGLAKLYCDCMRIQFLNFLLFFSTPSLLRRKRPIALELLRNVFPLQFVAKGEMPFSGG